jgi:hypothetical protein
LHEHDIEYTYTYTHNVHNKWILIKSNIWFLWFICNDIFETGIIFVFNQQYIDILIIFVFNQQYIDILIIIIFTSISRVQQWPIFVTYSLQYNWTVSGGIRNILTIYPFSKLDKGKQISSRATDDLGMFSDSSEVITLDSY